MQAVLVTGSKPMEYGEGDGCHPCEDVTERESPAGLEEGGRHIVRKPEKGHIQGTAEQPPEDSGQESVASDPQLPRAQCSPQLCEFGKRP